MACPPAAIYDCLVQQWPFVRSYVVERGRLFLSLMADGGIFQFEPSTASRSGSRQSGAGA
jgi:para-nitrobenzyl esterase